MSNDFSTDYAYDGTYSTLEERCFNESIDYDTATRKSIRFRQWQEMAIDKVKNKSGTNRSQVVYSAYLMGLKQIRDVVEISRVHELAQIRELMRDIAGTYRHDNYEDEERFDMALSGEIKDPLKHHGKVQEPVSCILKDSAVSEVKDTFEIDAKFNPWIHRSMVSLGLLKSGTCGPTLMQKAKEASRAVDGKYDQSRQIEESKVKEYLSHNVSYWLINGIKQGQYEMLQDAVDMMTTGMEPYCRQMMGSIEEGCEIIEDDD